MKLYDIHLNDECNNVGSGHRRVQVRSIGHKHVYIREYHSVNQMGFFSRVSRPVWDTLPKHEVVEPSVNNIIYGDAI